MKNKILVTGATGLLGAHVLVKLTDSGEEICALYRDEKSIYPVEQLFQYYKIDASFSRIQWVKADISDIDTLEKAIKNITQIYHCAALVSFDPKDAKWLFSVNVKGTRNLINLALNEGVQKVVHVSSTAAIGKSNISELLTEDNKWTSTSGNSLYAQSKFLAEQEVWRGLEEGLEVAIVNPCIIIGPGDWNKSSGTIFKQIENGLKFYTKGSNSFVDVRDVANAMIQLMRSEINGERFLVIGKNAPFKTIFDKIANQMGLKPPQWYAAPWLTSLAWRLEAVRSFLTGKSPLISAESVAASHRNISYSNRKIKSVLPIQFFKMDDAIENAILFQKFKNQNKTN